MNIENHIAGTTKDSVHTYMREKVSLLKIALHQNRFDRIVIDLVEDYLQKLDFQEPKYIIDGWEEIKLSDLKNQGITRWQIKEIKGLSVNDEITFNSGNNNEWDIKRIS